MRTYSFSRSRRVHATPATVWAILADYRGAHARILPEGAFSDYGVESGGSGEGTIFHLAFTVGGVTRRLHQRVLAPEPGRVLVERDLAGVGQTTFTLTPLDDGATTQLTILTEVPSRSGLLGVVERTLSRLVAPAMRKVYDEEIENLDRLAQATATNAVPPRDLEQAGRSA
jgi:hypothetical protein